MRRSGVLSRLAAAAGVALSATALVACGSGEAGPPAPRPDGAGALRVATTLSIFADFVREVGGDNVEVFSLLPPGADPHTYEPTPSDIERIAGADVIFVNDLKPDLEGRILDFIRDSQGGDTPLVAFAPALADAADGTDNPHLWLDPRLAGGYAAVISETLAQADTARAAFYEGNLAAYRQRLSRLDEELATVVGSIPPERRRLVTVHDAFRHLARRYGLEVVGAVVPGPGQDPSPRDLADLTEAIGDENVPAVFVEPQIGADSRVLEQVAADTGARVCTLYSDTLDDRVPTYVDMMRFNADQLVRCLGEASG